MFNVLIERGLIFLVAITLITQIVVPLFIPKLDLFWIFKMKSKPTATQQALTTAKEGEAAAAKAKWEQETIKAQKVTEAQQELEVQKLNTEKAASFKQQQILEGEGEGAKKRAIMQANGALEQKLATYERVQAMWAKAFGDYSGSLVPAYISGGGGNQVNAGSQFMELMMMKTAKDLNLDLKSNSKEK